MSNAESIDERERLASLANLSILDTLPEAGYEDVTKLASTICGTPISLVSFVDQDRQWFKSERGLGVRETPRSESFCAHTIGPRETLVVEDATADQRFQANPLVLGSPSIRFYAGAPIFDAGKVLGTVCVIDTVPRTLSAEQISGLEALARQVTVLLEQRRALAKTKAEAITLADTRKTLQLNEERMSLAADAAGIAFWFFDPATNIVGGDENMRRLFGLTVPEAPAEVWLEAIHPDDRDRVGREFAYGIAGHRYDTEYRVKNGDSITWIRAKAQLHSDATRHRMIGICEDVTSRKVVDETLRSTAERLQQQQERFSFATTAAGVGYWFCDLPFAELIWDHCVKEHFWLPSDAHVTIEIFYAVIHPDDREPTRQAIEASIASKTTYDMVYRTVGPDGKLKWIRAIGRTGYGETGNPLRFDGITIDITRQRQSEEALVKNEKLAVVGRMAASISHEINNPLESVTNLLYLIRTQAGINATLADYAAQAEEELARVSHIVTHTLQFNRESKAPQELRMSTLVESALAIYRARLTQSGVRLVCDLREQQTVFCMQTEIRQVLSNLIGNAHDASKKGGTLTLRTRDSVNWQTGEKCVRVTIADTGHGMNTNTRSRLFDAFFTTKGLNGTGLGLWVSAEILNRHKASVRVKSRQLEQLGGTIFLLSFPCSSAPIEIG